MITHKSLTRFDSGRDKTKINRTVFRSAHFERYILEDLFSRKDLTETGGRSRGALDSDSLHIQRKDYIRSLLVFPSFTLEILYLVIVGGFFI